MTHMIFDPSLLAARRGRRNVRRLKRSRALQWPSHRPQPRRAAGSISPIQQLRANIEFLRQSLDTHRLVHTQHRPQLELPRSARSGPGSDLRLRHTRSPWRTVCVFTVSQFRGSLHAPLVWCRTQGGQGKTREYCRRRCPSSLWLSMECSQTIAYPVKPHSYCM